MKLMLFVIWNLSILTLNAQHSSISKAEKDDILFMREEEKLARDVYDSLYFLWNLRPFDNIAHSEQSHMDQMKSLINRFELVDPVSITNDKPGIFHDTLLNRYYKDLTTRGSENILEALKVGAKIEEIDIKDLMDKSTRTKNKFILEVYENLRIASVRHLNAFVRNLKMRNFNYQPVVLDKKLFEDFIKE